MDDGFQNPSLLKDFSVLVVDGRRGIGNGAVIPAGPLRAPLAVQMERADALVVVGEIGCCGVARGHRRPRHSGVSRPARAGRRLRRRAWPGGRVLAFAGIGDPEKFFATLRDAGIDGCRDAQLSRPSSLHAARKRRRSCAQADREGLVLITTEKDVARHAR